jgi:hypothetical protein
MAVQLARRFDPGGHLGQAEADGLQIHDRRTVGLPLARIAHRGVERRLRHAHRLRRDRDPAVGQPDMVSA